MLSVLRNPRARLALAPLAVLALVVLALALASPSAHAVPHAVGLFDARQAPTYLVYLTPGGRVTYARGRNGYNCPRSDAYFSDVSAYTWRGGSLSVQRWSRDRTLTYWRSPDGGRVTFDGITFRNASASPVLVGGWCD